MISEAIVKRDGGALAASVYSSQQLRLIKNTYAKGATDQEFALFIEIAQRKGLDIFSRQIHLVKRWDSKLGREIMEPQTGIDGYRLLAERTQKYEGQLGPFWCGPDGGWKDVWLSDKPPAAAKVGTLKTGCREPFWAVALYKEYVQTRKDGTPVPMWIKMAANQLAKCAEALSLRKAFPNECAGIYTQEEMAQSSNGAAPVIEAEIVHSEAPNEEPAEKLANGNEKNGKTHNSDSELANEFYKRGRAAGIPIEALRETASQVAGGAMTWTEAIESLPEA